MSDEIRLATEPFTLADPLPEAQRTAMNVASRTSMMALTADHDYLVRDADGVVLGVRASVVDPDGTVHEYVMPLTHSSTSMEAQS